MSRTDSFLPPEPRLERSRSFIKQLELKNQLDQDRIWERFLESVGGDAAPAPNRTAKFASHPSLLVSGSELESPSDDDYDVKKKKFYRDAVIPRYQTVKPKTPTVKKRSISLVARKLLHEKLTKHLNDGTVSEFDVSAVGDEPRSSGGSREPRAGSETRVFYEKKVAASDSDASPKENAANETVREGNKAAKEQKKPPDVAVKKRVVYYIEKCIGLINELGCLLQVGPDLPDGKEDLQRRQQRTKEFASRFCRTYLYTLKRHIGEVDERHGNPRFIAAYQSVCHALRSLVAHLPTASGELAHQKLGECVAQALELCRKTAIAFRAEHRDDNVSTEDHIAVLTERCSELAALLDGRREAERERRDVAPPAPRQRCRGGCAPGRRFAMYAGGADAPKPRVKSRYRTAAYKHRPPADRTAPLACAVGRRRRVGARRSLEVVASATPRAAPLDDDNIETAVQYDVSVAPPPSEEVPETSADEGTDDILARLLHLVRGADGDLEDHADKLAKTIVVLQQCLDLKNRRAVQGPTPAELPDRHQTDDKDRPAITVTGAKNAQLICITSSEEPVAEPAAAAARPKKQKMSRLARPRRRLALLPKAYAISVIQYKLEFAQSCHGDPRYRRTTVRPWELIDRISDQLLDFALLGIAEEIEVNELLENMYNAEFQY